MSLSRIRNLVGGRLVDAIGGTHLESVEPATGRPHALVPQSDGRDVAAAVAAAREALPGWSSTPAEERSRHLLAVADAIEEHLDELARAECLDNGKPLSVARTVDIPRAAANFRFFATAILHTRSDLHVTEGRALNYTLRAPHGVVGLISPWNLPLYLLTWKIAPAIAAGNCAVAKPSEVTPYTAFLLSELLVDAGLPAGVVNILHGTGPSVGVPLVEHPEIKAISFTGGTRTGADIASRAAPRFKKLSLELGGKNPTIVFADADLEKATRESVRASFSNQGQICLCGSRVFVQSAIYKDFFESFRAQAWSYSFGDPMDPATNFGAVVSEAHLAKIRAHIEDARRAGARVEEYPRERMGLPPRCEGGYFIGPTIVTQLPDSCAILREEVFGPVVTIQPFESEDEVVALANGVEYGLAASVWTRELDRAHRVAARLECGTVWVNCWMLRDLRVPFGGTKASGVGREGGEEALRFFTEPKNVCIARGG